MKGMKFVSVICLCALLAVCLFCLPTRAEAASKSDLSFTLNGDGKSYSVTDCNGDASGELVIPATYNGKPVTTIGDDAFAYCTSLTSVTIPDSVTTIGAWAFNYCASLTSVTIPDGVTSIGSSAFRECASLRSVTIGDSVTTIGKYAFEYCDSLTSVTIPDSVTTIEYYAFAYCSSLTSVTIGDSVTTIGECAFEYCSSLTSVTIPDSVTTIGEYAFRGCDSLTSVTIPHGVTTIGECAFSYCASLTSVTIPDSVTTIGKYAFYYCDSLRDVYYAGTRAQWTALGYNSWYSVPTIHYNHTHNYTLFTPVTVAATCTEDGYIEYTCIHGEKCREAIPATGHSFVNGICTVCGTPGRAPGDLDGNETVTTDDVVALLLYISMPDMFSLPEGVSADFTGDGQVTTDDAVTLLLHISMPGMFPLETRKKDESTKTPRSLMLNVIKLSFFVIPRGSAHWRGNLKANSVARDCHTSDTVTGSQ